MVLFKDVNNVYWLYKILHSFRTLCVVVQLHTILCNNNTQKWKMSTYVVIGMKYSKLSYKTVQCITLLYMAENCWQMWCTHCTMLYKNFDLMYSILYCCKIVNICVLLARAVGVVVGHRSGNFLAKMLVATTSVIIFFSVSTVIYFSHRRSDWIKNPL